MGSILERKICKTNALSRLPGCPDSQDSEILPHSSSSPQQAIFAREAGRLGQFLWATLPHLSSLFTRFSSLRGGAAARGVPAKLASWGYFPKGRQAGCEITKNVRFWGSADRPTASGFRKILAKGNGCCGRRKFTSGIVRGFRRRVKGNRLFERGKFWLPPPPSGLAVGMETGGVPGDFRPRAVKRPRPVLLEDPEKPIGDTEGARHSILSLRHSCIPLYSSPTRQI
jgi:hypothetical protein